MENARRFMMEPLESFTEYRLRLRTLCEDFALIGRPLAFREAFGIWKKGLRETRWENVATNIEYDAVRGKHWTELEVIYAIERIEVFWGNVPMLQEATFILRNEGGPSFPDFQTWRTIGNLYVYAHDELKDHTTWMQADADNHFYWQGVYMKMLLPPDEFSIDPPNRVGMQIEDENAEEEDEGNVIMVVDEEEEEEEEEEDPEEDPWEEDEEGPNPTAQQANDATRASSPAYAPMDFDQDLQIPDSNRPEPELDPRLWRNVYEPSDYSMGRRSVTPTPSMQEAPPNIPTEAADQGNRVNENQGGNGERAGGGENFDWPTVEEFEAGRKRKRMTVMEYLRYFERKQGSTSRSSRSTPSP